MNKKLLCATDGSHSSDKAVEYAVEMANVLGAHVSFLTVTLVIAESVLHSRSCDSATLGAADAQLQKELQAAAAKAQQSGLEVFACVAIGGHNTAASIIYYAERNA